MFRDCYKKPELITTNRVNKAWVLYHSNDNVEMLYPSILQVFLIFLLLAGVDKTFCLAPKSTI